MPTIVVYLILLTLITPPLGAFMYRVYTSERIGRVEGVMKAVELSQRGLRTIHGDAVRRVVIMREQLATRPKSRGNDVERGACDVVRNFLLESRDGRSRLAHDDPAIGHDRAVEHLHERALSSAVAPKETHALSSLDVKRCAIEDQRSAERDRDVLHAEQRHSGALLRHQTIRATVRREHV